MRISKRIIRLRELQFKPFLRTINMIVNFDDEYGRRIRPASVFSLYYLFAPFS